MFGMAVFLAAGTTGWASSAEYLGLDTTTKGDWYAGSQSCPTYVYGGAGYEMIQYPLSSGWMEVRGNNLVRSYTNQTGNLTQYSNLSTVNYGPNSDTKFMRNPDEGLLSWTERYDSLGYSTDANGPIVIQFEAASEDQVRLVSFYAADSNGKDGRIEIYDRTGVTLLAQSDNFNTLGGVYAKFKVTGSFQAKVVRPNPWGNVILSGYFVDLVPPSGGWSSRARYLGVDTTTQGDWYVGPQSHKTYRYGSLGYEMVYYPTTNDPVWGEVVRNNLAASYSNQTGAWAAYGNLDVVNYGASENTRYLRNPDELLQPWLGRQNSFGFNSDSWAHLTIQFDAVSEDQERVVSFYVADDGVVGGHNQGVKIYDRTGNYVEAQSDYFNTSNLNGYVRFRIKGSFQAKIERQDVQTSGRVLLSGYFVDPPPQGTIISIR